MKIERFNENSMTQLFSSYNKGDIMTVVHDDYLDSAMWELQDMLEITDGGVCSMYWSAYDDADLEWSNASITKRMVHLHKYIELEDSYSDSEDDD